MGRDGTTISLRGGVVRVGPDGTDLEIVSTGLRNLLSVALNSHDDVFTYGNDDDSKKFPNSILVTDWTQPGQLVTGATSAGRLFRLTYHGTDAVQAKSRLSLRESSG